MDLPHQRLGPQQAKEINHQVNANLE